MDESMVVALIVDDEPGLLSAIRVALEQPNWTIITATNPEIALALARNAVVPIDLLISDVLMPEMNGFELAQQISCCFPQMKCLMMSGHTADTLQERCVVPPDINFIRKPFRIRELRDRVREILSDSAATP